MKGAVIEAPPGVESTLFYRALASSAGIKSVTPDRIVSIAQREEPPAAACMTP
jgi:hypothetical protein